jgi:hypothetical protein
MEQLHCDLFFKVTPELEPLREADLWSGRDLAEWEAEVERRDGFRAVMGIAPLESRVEQWEV